LYASRSEKKTAFVSHKHNLIKPSFISLVQEDNTRMQGKLVQCMDATNTVEMFGIWGAQS
jgi:hypothetical protein